MKLNLKLKCDIFIVLFLFFTCVNNFQIFASSNIKTSWEKNLVEGNNAFCFDLYQLLKEKEGNIFISPYSISYALAMTYAGAHGVTEKEMAKVLHFVLPKRELHQEFFKLASIIRKIKENGNITLNIANSLWIQKNFNLKKEFIKITDKFYKAVPFIVDFIPDDLREKTRKKINLWVEDKTREKIKNLISKGILSAETRLVLTNAVYFKGDWSIQFKKHLTRNAPFWLSENKKIDIPIMFLGNSLKYMEDKNIQILELPYKGEEVSMLIILPHKEFGIKKLELELKSNPLNEWVIKLRRQKVVTYLPKFKITSKYSMNKILESMGMVSAFSGSANFSGISKGPLFISDVIHEAFVEVNEQGTEAAASTAVILKKGPVRFPIFRANHPFIFIIKENKSGSILFMGRVSNPSSCHSN